MLPRGETLEEVRGRFDWKIPEFFNIGVSVCDRWATEDADRVAIIHDNGEAVEHVSYGQLQAQSNQLMALLADLGVRAGDRVGILLPQNPWTAVAHIAAWKMGAISIPLFTLFGQEALQYRLSDSSTKVVVTDIDGVAKIREIRHDLPALRNVLCINGPCEGALDLCSELSGVRGDGVPLDTRADAPALIVYTSGTTGNPKGALHAHRTLLGHLPGVEMSHDFFPQPGDKIWTPADWAWIGGLMDVLMPALYHGVPVVSRRFDKFNGKKAFAFINQHGIRNAFLPPTALKMMRMDEDTQNRLASPMRSIASAGESLGAELLEWGREAFGIWINEFYGQTECNMIVSSCGCLRKPEPGVMGFPVPGHDVHVISTDGEILGVGELGQIAVRGRNPVMFLGYWNQEEKTQEKYQGEWLLTGDTGMLEPSGALRFVGRDDDVITSSGYRIGPGEIENCLLGHPAVAMSAVIGKPDPVRTEIVKAFVKLNPGYEETGALKDELQHWVKTRLSAHEYPREIDFIENFPFTTTGKIIRRKLREFN